jgi:hypothetical protein
VAAVTEVLLRQKAGARDDPENIPHVLCRRFCWRGKLKVRLRSYALENTTASIRDKDKRLRTVFLVAVTMSLGTLLLVILLW